MNKQWKDMTLHELAEEYVELVDVGNSTAADVVREALSFDPWSGEDAKQWIIRCLFYETDKLMYYKKYQDSLSDLERTRAALLEIK